LAFSTHYYVLSLSEKRNALFEAFRDSLIEVENRGFPVIGKAGASGTSPAERRLALAREVDERFGHYQTSEPLKLIVVGEPDMLAAFQAVTVHAEAMAGQVDGDHEAADVRDLGQIVWPVVKQAMSGVLNGALRELRDLAERGRVVAGLEAVARAVDGYHGPTLLVEDDYHVRGSIVDCTWPPAITSEVDIRSTIDDVVDLVIERVLLGEGEVLFVPPGSLDEWNHIVLLLRDERSQESGQTPGVKPRA